MGAQARPALPELMRVFRDPGQWSGMAQGGHRAGNVLSGLGKEALPQILDCFSEPQFTNGRVVILVDVIRHMPNVGEAGNRAVPILCDLLARNDPSLGPPCVEALGNLAAAPDLAVPAITTTLTNALAASDTTLSRKSAEALGKFGHDASNAVPVLCLALKSPDGITTEEAARALGKIGASSDMAVPALIEYLKQSTPKHRKYAIEGLAGYGDAAGEAASLIGEALQDEDHDTRSVARQALEQLTHKP
jgi:HEAT repeat protein